MDNCCSVPTKESTLLTECPVCHGKGKGVQIITLKALLKPIALETINPEASHVFCPNPSCEVVYFSDVQTYHKSMLKVSVYQKDEALDVPVCYCFDWTRTRLMKAVQEKQRPTEHIREQVQANRCGCEVNNPQGACCLGNVTTYIRSLDKR